MARTIGAEFSRKLGMERILAELGLSEEQQRIASRNLCGGPEVSYGKSKRNDCPLMTVGLVVDAGIGIEKNLVALREAGFHYICVGRGKPLEQEDDTDEGMVLIKARAENVDRGKVVKAEGEWIFHCESRR